MAIFNWFKKNKKNKEEIEEIKGEEIETKENIEEIKEKAEELKDDLKEETISIKEGLKENIEEIKEKAEELKDDLKEETISIKEELKENIEEIKEKAEELKDDLKEETEKKAEELKENIDEIEQDISEITGEFIQNLLGTEEPEVEPEQPIKKQGFFAKIKSGIAKTRDSILNGIENVLSGFTKIDEDLFEELEEALIMADIGTQTSCFIIEKVRQIVKAEKIKDVAEIKQAIVRVITEILQEGTDEFELKSPSVLLIIGVNGVGKTTTIGKLTNNYQKQGKKVILGAADTFRAAAIDQLQVWGDRNGVDVIKHQENSDPAAVVFDAVQASKARKADLLICDTAGRLHNKKNLMEELKKISRVINKEHPNAQVETLLVLDATTGQNALQQAKLFSEVADITGLVLTKLDGTAKGGIIIAIKNELKIPVRFIGVGEGIDDLRPFDAKEFSAALFE